MDMHTQKSLAATAAALIVLMPMQAMAQDMRAQETSAYDRQANVSVRDRPRPEYDPLGLRFGGFDAHGSTDLSVESTDNVLATETASESDMLLGVGVNGRLASHWSRHSLTLQAGADRAMHQDFPKNDSTDYYLRADGRLDIYRSTEIGGGVGMAEDHEQRTEPDAPNGALKPVEYQRNDIHAYARHAFSRVRVTGRVAVTDLDYEDVAANGGGTLDQDYRDHKEKVASGRLEVALTPRIALLAEGSANTREYDDGVLDSDGRTYAVGVNFDITDLMRGEIIVGQFDQDYDSAAIGNVEGTLYAGRLEWFPSQITTVNVNLARSVEESSLGAASYVQTQLGARVDHELRRNVILSAGVRQDDRDYEGVAREDKYLSADVGATYLLNRRLRLRGGYAFDRNESNAPGEDFEVNRLFVGLSLHL